MVKIISRQLAGNQTVYDLGVEKDHNFLLANGLIASNCFNKSHSTAYAYVTYQTAYLKANYPVEYMTALLTASSDSQDKVEKYRENCKKMGIDVEPPDINRSQKDFTPVGEKILFGLSAVRNLGENAIENILKAREEAKGKFESLADFCLRVDLRVVNRRALETLIYCGAFDNINNNRNQLIQYLDIVIPWAQKRTKEKESGQLSLFDSLGGLTVDEENSESKFDLVPSLPSVEPFSLDQKLKLEKEHLGFYVSEHPLQSIVEAAKFLSPINLNELENQSTRKMISAVVMINSVKKITTKEGKPMAFVGLEDISGQVEGIVFPSAYPQIQDILTNECPLIIWGKVQKNKDDDKIQIIIEDAEPVEKVKMVMIYLSPKDVADAGRQIKLKTILQGNLGDKNLGKIPVIAIIGQGNQRQTVRLGQKYWVHDDYSAVKALQDAGFSADPQSLLVSR
ncbi:trans-splicing intein-formed DNA polymerase III subunit alpha C-terminal partner DnaE-C [Gloeothece verrucosa]|uniref:Nucleic acid binding OB-fold tRNA/helicase-type n=1 Tax=Gloeothece verrucosa (strain PCC 7822) TaxID=497965 RepID=E0UIY0_GLOV7|nr:trans-splicing intein-formed DNA polymerase III subunit alpha C-terminal partner DnaE-C [Gloeothece verrucosa]ADN14560.1 nucleic acid binding OB-fold tRNA/helicase-type [Gloeothece verrucosa PCC 7822]